MQEEEIENFEPYQKQLEDSMINELLNYVREGTKLKNPASSMTECYSIVYSLSNKKMNNFLIKYYNEVSEKAVTECYEKIKDLSGTELIDSFIMYTERLNCLFYFMAYIFSYIREGKYAQHISHYSMNSYKQNFYDKLKEKIDEILKGDTVNEEKKGKIKTLISFTEIKYPKIIKTSPESFAWTEDKID